MITKQQIEKQLKYVVKYKHLVGSGMGFCYTLSLQDMMQEF